MKIHPFDLFILYGVFCIFAPFIAMQMITKKKGTTND